VDKSTYFKPPIFCKNCHKETDAILACYINKEAKIMFCFVCPKCNLADIQTFVMDFAQTIAYCLCREKGMAGYVEGTETVH
jgi:hypothetical protein